jgi:small subunit ribosomal protein S17
MAELKIKKTTKIAPKKTDSTQDASQPAKAHRRTMTGVVVSDKMMKTRVVRVERQVKNAMYGKYISETNKFKIHDEDNRAKVGDLVLIVESRPLSREKRWALQKIIRTASGEVLTKG